MVALTYETQAEERTRRRPTSVILLAGLAGMLAAVAAGAGVFLRGDLATRTVTTPRGEEVEMLAGGVYRFNSLAIAAEGVGWDMVTLFVVAPVLALALAGTWNGSLRATLLVAGLLAYLAYQYLQYATFLAYGPLFLVYVAIFALSLSGLAVLIARIDLSHVAASVNGLFPRRAVIGLAALVALLLSGMWLPMVLQTATEPAPDVLVGATTLIVQAFDLGLLVPLGVFTAVAVHRRAPIGYVLAGIVVVKAAAMGLAIVAMLVFEAVATGELAVAPIAIFAVIAIGSAAIGVRLFQGMEGENRDAELVVRPSGV